MTALSLDVGRRRDELLHSVQHLDGVSAVFAAASRQLRLLVPFDAAAWIGTDPATGMPTTPSRVENVRIERPEQCLAYWRSEYLHADVNKFSALARASTPAASLRADTPDPTTSRRFRAYIHPWGFDDELRAVLRSGDTPWGMLTLWRHRGAPPFSARETQLVASLSTPLAEAVRHHARRSGDTDTARLADDRPGLLMFDPADTLLSVNDEARGWLEQLPSGPRLATDLAIDIPLWMTATVFQARALAESGAGGTARVRLRTRSGRWLVCHGTSLSGADGAVTHTAMVIEPARGAEIAPLIVEAFGLSQREREITRLITRGVGTGDIAGELHLSPHTVRDHVKAIFHKVGVSSRGELVARLFGDHYWPVHDREIVHADTD